MLLTDYMYNAVDPTVWIDSITQGRVMVISGAQERMTTNSRAYDSLHASSG
jgi:hypothetical protein